MEKFCGCVRLQLGVFISISISAIGWMFMLIVYIPYILFYSPREILADFVEDEQEAFRTAVPGEDFGTGRIAPVIILMALFVDILLLSGVYKTYYLKTDLLIPWLFFYSVFSVALISAGFAVAVLEEGVMKACALIPILLAVFYIYNWVCVLHLFQHGKETKNIVMKRLNSIALQPLVAIAQKSIQQSKEYP